MMPGRSVAQLGLAGINLLLAGLLIFLIAAPLTEFAPPAVRLKPRSRPISMAPPTATPSPEAFADIDAHPLFNPDRKPIAASATAQATQAPPDIVLVGIILDSRDRMALIRTPAAPLATAFHMGATISGWEVTDIAADHIVLSAGGARDEIRLDANHGASKPSPVGAMPSTSP